MRLASVSPLANRFVMIVEPAPITCVTAIASPSARLRPRIVAAAMPAARRVEDDAADHLPARRAERERAVLELARER